MADAQDPGGRGASGAKRPRKATQRPAHKAAEPSGARVAFPGISSRAYEHPADRAALVTLRGVPGFDVLLKGMFGFFSERRLRMMYLASAVRVDERQFPAIYAIYQDC